MTLRITAPLTLVTLLYGCSFSNEPDPAATGEQDGKNNQSFGMAGGASNFGQSPAPSGTTQEPSLGAPDNSDGALGGESGMVGAQAQGGDPSVDSNTSEGGAAANPSDGGQNMGGSLLAGMPLAGEPMGGSMVGGGISGGVPMAGEPVGGSNPIGGLNAGGVSVPMGGMGANCPDVDRDNTCDGRDLHCNVDALMVTCRRLTPACPVGTVPEVKDECFTGECVSWEECAQRVGPVP